MNSITIGWILNIFTMAALILGNSWQIDWLKNTAELIYWLTAVTAAITYLGHKFLLRNAIKNINIKNQVEYILSKTEKMRVAGLFYDVVVVNLLFFYGYIWLTLFYAAHIIFNQLSLKEMRKYVSDSTD